MTVALRTRATITTWFAVLVVLAAVLAAGGVWATHTAYVTPGETVEERTTTLAAVNGSFDHSATVIRENPVFPVGERLTTRSTYFTEASPTLNGSYTLHVSGFTNATAQTQVALVVQSADESQTYWTDRRRLNATTARIGSNESVRVGFAVNVSRVASRIGEIRASLGGVGTVTTTVVVRTRVNGTVAGERRSITTTDRLAVSLDGGTYTVSSEAANASAGTVRQTETVRSLREYGPSYRIGGPLAILLGVSGLVVLGFGRLEQWFTLSEHERDRLAFLDDRAEYDEWIVSARVPPPRSSLPVAETDSLADLVDLAIDANTTVVEDPDGETFVAVTDDYRFVYHAPLSVTDRAEPTPAAARSDGRGYHAGVPTQPDDRSAPERRETDDRNSTDETGDDATTAAGDPAIDVDGASGVVADPDETASEPDEANDRDEPDETAGETDETSDRDEPEADDRDEPDGRGRGSERNGGDGRD